MASAFIQRVQLKSYKSIAACDVYLGPLNLLIGANGSGKSNFLDALRLIADALNSPLDHALRQRGGIDAVRQRRAGGPGRPPNFAIGLYFTLPSGSSGTYSVQIAATRGGGFRVSKERLTLDPSSALDEPSSYHVADGEVRTCSLRNPPQAAPDRLYLVNLSGTSEFREAFDTFSSMGFYSIDPVQIRNPQPPDSGRILDRDGKNIASVVSRLSKEDPRAISRVCEYLSRIVPGVEKVEEQLVATRETLRFYQHVKGSEKPWKFYASSMSDGTLRALGVLVALFQRGAAGNQGIPLVGLEEPESALHPAAAGILLDALRVASAHTQVIATTHSPQLLDDEGLSDDEILAVRAVNGVSEIGPLDAGGREAIKSKLFTAGELLAQGHVDPDQGSIASPEQLELFK